MTNLDNYICRLTTIFDRMDVAYALMGSIATRVYAIPRPMQDLEILAAMPDEKIGDFFRRCESIGFSTPFPYWADSIERLEGMPFVRTKLYLDGSGLDVALFLVNSTFQENVISRSRKADICGQLVWIVSPEDLVLLNLILNHSNEIADLFFVQRDFDLDYMSHWARELGISDRLEEVIAKAGSGAQ